MSHFKDMQVLNTTLADRELVLSLFREVMNLGEHRGYKVWDSIDHDALDREIQENSQFKVVRDGEIFVLFSVQYSDPLIWGHDDRDDAIYLHRIVVNPKYKGQRQFESVLRWAEAFALSRQLRFIRMDTWADNSKLIDYYKSFGFQIIRSVTTPNDQELPVQNRNLKVVLLQKWLAT